MTPDALPDDSELTPADPALPDDSELTPAPPSDTELDAQLAPHPPGFLPVEPLVTLDERLNGDRRAAENARIQLAFDESQKLNVPTEQQVLAISTALNVPGSVVRTNLDDFKRTAAAAKFDADAWGKANPELKRLILDYPDLAPLVVTKKELGPFAKALRILMAGDDALGEQEVDILTGAAAPGDAALRSLFSSEAERTAKAGEQVQQVEAQRTFVRGLVAPKTVQELDTAEARAISGNPILVAMRRGEEAKLQLEVSKKGVDLMRAELAGEDTTGLQQEIHDLRLLATPLALGDSPLMSDTAQGLVSSGDVLGTSIKGGGLGALAGGALVGAVEGLATRSPAAAVAGFKTGAGLGLKYGAGTGAAVGTMRVETGSTYLDLREMKLEDGKRIPVKVAAGAAVLAGTLKTVIELAELDLQLKSVGPLGEALKAGNLSPLKKLLATSPGFRGLITKLAPAGKAAAGEAGEEGAQDVVDQVTSFLAEWNTLEHAPAHAPVRLAQTADAMASAVPAGVVFGLGGAATHLASERLAQSFSAASTKQVEAAQALAADEVVRAAPGPFAEAVAKAGGPADFFVDGAELVRFYQSKKEDVDEAAKRDLGPEGPQRLREALAGDGKVRVAGDEYLGGFGATEAGKATVKATSVGPDVASAAELKASGQADLAEAKRAAQEEIRTANAEADFSERIRTIEQQAVDTGKVTRAEARKVAGLHRMFYEAVGKAFGATPEAVIGSVRVSIASGESVPEGMEKPTQGGSPTPAAFLEARTRGADVTSPKGKAQAQREMWVDTTTGALGERAWARREKTAETVTAFDFEGLKWTNDNAKSGHNAGDELFAAVAAALHETGDIGELYKVKGGFLVADLSPEQAQAVALKASKSARLKGFAITAATIDTATPRKISHRSAVADASTKLKDELEKQGTRSKRGEMPQGAKPGAFPSEQPIARYAVPDWLKAELDALSPEAAHREKYFEPGTGLLTREGRDLYLASHRKQFYVSVDQNFIGPFNNTLIGEAGTDRIIEAFGKLVKRTGGERFVATHVSGDEFTLHGNSEAELLNYLEFLKKEADKEFVRDIITTDRQGNETGVVDLAGLWFGFGVGKNVTEAEEALHAHKQQLAKDGRRGVDAASSLEVAKSRLASRPLRHAGPGREAGVGSEHPRGGAGREALGAVAGDSGPGGEGRGGLAGGARATEGGGGARGARATEGGGAQADVGGGGRGPGASAERDQAVAARIASARRFLEKVDPEIRQIATQYLDSLEGKGEAPTGPVAERVRAEIDQRLGLPPTRLYAPGENVPRGYTDMPSPKELEPVYRIMLNADADFSTLVHESAHVFLHLLEQLAKRPDAPQSVQRHLAAAREALGVAKDEAFQTEHHEAFAEGFEKWLWQGRAPSQGLARAFAAMRAFLVKAYRAVAGDGELVPPKLADVFARLLATDAEVDAFRQKRGPDAFGSAEEAGMSEKEWEDYLAQRVERELEAARGAEVSVLKSMLRAQEPWWKKARDEQLRLAEERFEELPGRRAQRLLQGTTENGVTTPPALLDRQAVVDLVGEERAALFPTAEVGESPDDIARLAGFETGQEMLEAVADLPSKESWSTRQADAMMEALHPDGLRDRAHMRQLIAEGLTGSEFEQGLLRELGILEALRARTEGRAPRVTYDTATMKAQAELVVKEKRLRYLRPGSILKRERQAAINKARAVARGDYAGAIEFGRQQMYATVLYREMLAAVKERQRFVKLGEDMATEKAALLASKASPLFRDSIDLLLALLGFKEPDADITVDFDELQKQLANDADSTGEWLDFVREAVTRNALGAWQELRFGEMQQVHDALKALRAAVRNRNEVIVAEKRAERDFVISELLREADEGPRKDGLSPMTLSARETKRSAGDFASAFDGELISIPRMVDDIAGERTDSMWFKVFVEPTRKAAHYEADLLKKAVKPILDAFEAMPAKVRARMMEKVDGRKLFPGHRTDFAPPSRRFELLMMGLHTGNRSNLYRLTEGRHITLPEVRAAMDLLTAEELAFIQSIWDANESLKEVAFDAEERDSGVRPEAIEPVAQRYKNGRLAGGYAPVAYESQVSHVGRLQEGDALAQLMDPSFTRPGTPHSHTKARAEEFSDVVSLEPAIIYRHLVQVAHDAAWREVVKSTGSLILSPAIQEVLRRKLGNDKAKQWLEWAKNNGTLHGVETVHAAKLMGAIRYFRSVLPVSYLGWNAATALGDFGNLPAAPFMSKLATMHLAAGVAEALGAPLETYTWVNEKSGAMRTMRDELSRRFRDDVKQLTRSALFTRSKLSWVSEHAFWFMETVSKVVSTPVWVGAYRQALAEGKGETDAVLFADDVVTKVFPATSNTERPGVLRDKGFVGVSTMFYSYFSQVYGAAHRIWQPLVGSKLWASSGAGDRAALVAKASGATLGLIVAVNVLSELFSGRGPEDGDKDKDEPDSELRKWRNWLLRKAALAPLTWVPFGGDVAALTEARVLHKQANPRAGIVSSMVDSVFRGLEAVMDEDKTAGERLKGAVHAAGALAPVPQAPLTKNLPYVVGAASGDIEVPSVPAALSGAVYGEKKDKPATAIDWFPR